MTNRYDTILSSIQAPITYSNGVNIQKQADLAIICPTLLRPTLIEFVQSVLDQDFPGTIHLLLGIDKPLYPKIYEPLAKMIDDAPPRFRFTIVNIGYSTGKGNGGMFAAYGGGMLAILGYMANSEYVFFANDDNYYHKSHCAIMMDTVKGYDWAYSARWFIDQENRECLMPDMGSVGPNYSIEDAHKQTEKPFVDLSSMVIKLEKCEPALRELCHAYMEDGCDHDRQFIRALFKDYSFNFSDCISTYYEVSATDTQLMFYINQSKHKYSKMTPERITKVQSLYGLSDHIYRNLLKSNYKSIFKYKVKEKKGLMINCKHPWMAKDALDYSKCTQLDIFLSKADAKNIMDEAWYQSESHRIILYTDYSKAAIDLIERETYEWMALNDALSEHYIHHMLKLFYPTLTPGCRVLLVGHRKWENWFFNTAESINKLITEHKMPLISIEIGQHHMMFNIIGRLKRGDIHPFQKRRFLKGRAIKEQLNDKKKGVNHIKAGRIANFNHSASNIIENPEAILKQHHYIPYCLNHDERRIMLSFTPNPNQLIHASFFSLEQFNAVKMDDDKALISLPYDIVLDIFKQDDDAQSSKMIPCFGLDFCGIESLAPLLSENEDMKIISHYRSFDLMSKFLNETYYLPEDMALVKNFDGVIAATLHLLARGLTGGNSVGEMGTTNPKSLLLHCTLEEAEHANLLVKALDAKKMIFFNQDFDRFQAKMRPFYNPGWSGAPKRWEMIQQLKQHMIETHGSDSVLMVNYNDIVNDPYHVLHTIADFL